ncbi:MAG: DUF6526 family protein [Flavipsychrobacter sp.]
MEQQNYKNHVRYYTPHHFVFYPVLAVALIIAASCAIRFAEQRYLWMAVAVLIILIGCLSFMMRQHYALNNQNRIVRLELRLRYYILTQQRLEPIEQQLSFGQLAALRFASDEELPALIERAVQEYLSANDIKRSIKNWQPDYMRV